MITPYCGVLVNPQSAPIRRVCREGAKYGQEDELRPAGFRVNVKKAEGVRSERRADSVLAGVSTAAELCWFQQSLNNFSKEQTSAFWNLNMVVSRIFTWPASIFCNVRGCRSTFSASFSWVMPKAFRCRRILTPKDRS